ncbi:ABC1-domain-containing protein, partial [Ramicandelaber brevisporus]
SAVHRRSAIRMREALNRNGGVYIKLGQHLAALTYVLPREWTEPMAALQDKCQTTPFEDVEQLLLTELGIERLDDVFESFEREPVGTASLAQVHRATASAQPNNATRAVAVKIQHPYLQKHAGIDARTIGAIVRLVKKVLPEFSFEWLADELRESLPRELDFRHEWSNAEQVRANFAATSQDSLTIPKMHLARKRVLMMEFIEGSRPDDIAYLHKHEIRPERVAARLTQVFNEMVYTHGFVHCDPHPGNMLVRPRRDLAAISSPSSTTSLDNFDLVLLDHGLYRTVDHSTSTNYAKLWLAMFNGDERGIERYSRRLLNGDGAYRVLAVMLTGRAWQAIEKAKVGSGEYRDGAENRALAEGAGDFLGDVADILAKLPRQVVFLLKTSDLLRGVTESL